jgi:hypothetical protein
MRSGQKGYAALADSGVFYEFIPTEEWDKEHPKTVLLADVEVGQKLRCNDFLQQRPCGDTCPAIR